MDLKVRSFADVGVRVDNLRASLLPYTFLTIGAICGLDIVLNTVGHSLLLLWHLLYPTLVPLIFLAVLQEIFFRGYLMMVLRRMWKEPAMVITVNALLFAAMHLALPYQYVQVPLAFLLGLSFATVYYYYPNLFLVSLAHIAVNISVIPLCYLGFVNCSL